MGLFVKKIKKMGSNAITYYECKYLKYKINIIKYI